MAVRKTVSVLCSATLSIRKLKALHSIVITAKNKNDLLVILFLLLKNTTKPSMPIAAAAIPTENNSTLLKISINYSITGSFLEEKALGVAPIPTLKVSINFLSLLPN